MSGSNIETLAKLNESNNQRVDFGKFYKSEMYASLKHVIRLLMLWARKNTRGSGDTKERHPHG